MLAKTTHLELPRRVTAYYLLFGLAAVAWLTVGVVVVSRALITSRDESACLNNLGRGARLVATEYLRSGDKNLQALVERLARESALAYCAVVSVDGQYLAHTSPEQIGQAAPQPTGAVAQWGDVERVRFIDGASQVLREYRTPVRRGTQTLAMLHIAVADQGVWNVIRSATEYAPAAILGPLLLMILGALVLRRVVRPIGDIEKQLAVIAEGQSLDAAALRPIALKGPAGIGWNRLLEDRGRTAGSKSLEARLSEALEGFRQRKADLVLNSLPDGVALTDEQGQITFANQALAPLLGLGMAGEALLGKTMEECLALNGTQADSPLLNPDLHARSVVSEIGRSGDMSHGVLRVARHPLRTAQNTSAGGYVWSVRDITQQKLAEQMRNQFVNSATHELRTPLANIRAYAETLALSELDVERQKEFCNTINSEATRLARFIDDLLSISSMEVGSLSLARQETDMERLFREAIDKVRPQMTQKRLAFESLLPDKLPKLKVDKDKIAATLVNLLGNAVKYTPEGGSIRFQVLTRPDHLQIEVEDSGIGISAEDMPKLFEKFFRSSDPRVQQVTGSGLGLSLAQEIVRLHGGKLGVQSELNKGTRFTITLPLA